ncbi:MAG: phosphatidylserine decarboxylase family protein [Bacteroidota bacterium]
MSFRLHREGHVMLAVFALLLSLLNFAVYQYLPIAFWPILVLTVVFYGIIVQFFRNPVRVVPVIDNGLVYAPADGRVCVIEEVTESEYFNDRRLQVSIFMSPFNVHVNRNPVSGIVRYFKYHPGKYLVAWHPKSSTENERTTVVYDLGGTQILMRQIAGALAKRIKWYIGEGQQVEQGAEMGFIKFGSRVDLYLPLNTHVEVIMDEQVKGNKTVIARLG